MAVAGLSLLALSALPYAVDDAFIVFRYAADLVAGAGWTFNAGRTPTDGVTGPLWLLPALAAISAGLSPLWVARALGLLSAAAAAAMVVARLRRRCGGTRGAWVAAGLLAVAPNFAIWSIAGLSTGLAALLATGAALAATRRPSPRPVVLGVCIAALAWLRPELAPFALVLVGGTALRDVRQGALAFVVAALGAGAVVGLRLWLFGDPLPLSFYAKPADVSLGASYAVRGALVITGIGGAALPILATLLGRREEHLLGVALFAHLLAITLAGGDWMPGFRLHAPVIPVYALVAGGLFTRPPPQLFAPKALAATCLGMALLVPGLDAWAEVPRAADAGRIRRTDGALLARLLSESGDSVALLDIGYLGYASGLEIVDLGGVTDPVIAHERGGHADKEIDFGYLDRRRPDLVVLSSRGAPVVAEDGHVRLQGAFPVEHRLARSDWLASGYAILRVVPYGEGHYVVFTRR